MLPQQNATIVAVRAPSGGTGTRDDWDADGENAPADPAAVRWAGAEPAYLLEEVLRSAGAAGADVSLVRSVIVETDVARTIGVEVGDAVEVRTPGGRVVEGNVEALAMSDLTGIPGAVRTTRLTLEST